MSAATASAAEDALWSSPLPASPASWTEERYYQLLEEAYSCAVSDLQAALEAAQNPGRTQERHLDKVAIRYEILSSSIYSAFCQLLETGQAAEQRNRDLEAEVARLHASAPAPGQGVAAAHPLTASPSAAQNSAGTSGAPEAAQPPPQAPTVPDASPRPSLAQPSAQAQPSAPAAQQQQQSPAQQQQQQRAPRRRGVRAGARVQARRAAREEQASAPAPPLCHPTALASVERMLADTVRAVLGAGRAQCAPAAASQPRRRAARPPAARAPARPAPRPAADRRSDSDTESDVAPPPGRLHRVNIKRRRDARSASSVPASLSGVSSTRQQASPTRMPAV